MTIDRTKYEGHTPGPWLAREYWSGSWFLMDDNGGREFARFESGPDARLAADAPALLAELDKVTAQRDALAEALLLIQADLSKPWEFVSDVEMDSTIFNRITAALATLKETTP